MKGRKPKPTALRRLGGKAGHRPLNEHEPRPSPVTVLRPPAWLRPDARQAWRELTRELTAVGLFTKLDTWKVAVLAVALAEHQRVYLALGTAIAAEAGSALADEAPRLLRALRQQAETVRSLSAGFGLDPSDRVRLAVPKPPDSHDEFAEFDEPPPLVSMPKH